jgi:hypothetical protein
VWAFLWLGTIICVAVGTGLAFAGWHHWAARALLIAGIGYAVLLLLVDRFRRR